MLIHVDIECRGMHQRKHHMNHGSKATLLCFGTAVLIGMSGCGAKQDGALAPSLGCVIEGITAPDWVCDGKVSVDYIAAVGDAAPGALGPDFARREAMAKGRSRLAQQIDLRVKDSVTALVGSIGIGDNNVTRIAPIQISKQVAQASLSKAIQLKYWQAPSREVYLLMAVPRSVINAQLREQTTAFYRSDAALWQQFQAKNAMPALERAFPVD